MDAKRLIALAAASVPDRIIDVMVALSYPTAFAVRPSSTAPGLLTSDEPRGGGRIDGFGIGGRQCAELRAVQLLAVRMGCLLAVLPTVSSGCRSAIAIRPLAPCTRAMAPEPLTISVTAAWAMAATAAAGIWQRQPTVIVLNPGNSGTAQHGQVVNGRGYVEGGTGRSTAVPIDSGSSSSGSSGGSSSGGSGATSSPSGAGDSGGGRTAVPR